MLKSFIGCKIINAEPQAHKDGRPGYAVYYPDGYSSWSPKAIFEAAYREIAVHERQVMNMTEGEAAVALISDGDPEHASEDCTSANGHHRWEYVNVSDDYRCFNCQAQRFTRPDKLG